jgi:hypothetical protein
MAVKRADLRLPSPLGKIRLHYVRLSLANSSSKPQPMFVLDEVYKQLFCSKTYLDKAKSTLCNILQRSKGRLDPSAVRVTEDPDIKNALSTAGVVGRKAPRITLISADAVLLLVRRSGWGTLWQSSVADALRPHLSLKQQTTQPHKATAGVRRDVRLKQKVRKPKPQVAKVPKRSIQFKQCKKARSSMARTASSRLHRPEKAGIRKSESRAIGKAKKCLVVYDEDSGFEWEESREDQKEQSSKSKLAAVSTYYIKQWARSKGAKL